MDDVQESCEIFMNGADLAKSISDSRMSKMWDKENTSALRILIVDDVAVNRKLLQLMLSRLGYGSNMVTNGKEAVEALAIQPYDLIFMDLQMPILDGLRAAQTIRENLAGKPQPYIIAITAYADRFDRETCKNAGMDDYITKPATLNDIREALKSAKIRMKKKGLYRYDEKTMVDGIY
ncbi:MAG: response regulator [Methanotrichaceae archaeon]